jgi:hypothetical protein
MTLSGCEIATPCSSSLAGAVLLIALVFGLGLARAPAGAITGLFMGLVLPEDKTWCVLKQTCKTP